MTKKITVTFDLEVEEDELPCEADVVKQLLRDALGEFGETRGNNVQGESSVQGIVSYVQRRYSTHPEFFKTRKIVEVCQRLDLASLMMKGLHTLETKKAEP